MKHKLKINRTKQIKRPAPKEFIKKEILDNKPRILIFVIAIAIFIVCSFLFNLLTGVAFTVLLFIVIFFAQILDNNPKKSKKRKSVKLLFIIILIAGIIGLVLFIVFFGYIVYKAPKFDVSKLEESETTLIYDNANKLVATLGVEKREELDYEELPQVLIDAIVATEDSRFFQHNGFDAPRFLKASVGQLLGQNAGGASTLTMQIAKNNFTSTNVSVTRKFTDIYLSIFKIERAFTKEEIIEFYVNEPYLGSSSYGVEQASQTYFGKSASNLNLAEASLIAGLFQAPGAYDPNVDPEAASNRRDTVLLLMVKHGYITQEEADIASSISIEDLLTTSNSGTTSEFQGYIDTVVDEVEEKTGLDPYAVPMIIYSNMDTEKQRALNKVFNGKSYKWPTATVQSGVAAIDTATGKIIAIGAGRNRSGERTFNYATDINKQIGSTAKPVFDYAPGIEYNNWSTYTIFKDEPYTYSNGLSMKNFDSKYKGVMTLREALRQSRNVPALKAFQSVDNASIIKFVTTLGITPEISSSGYLHEAHAIGGFNGASPLIMAGAYAAFSNGGSYYEPYSVNKVILRETEEELTFSSEKVEAMSDSTAYMITDVLKGVASDIRVTSAVDTQIAAKTGTTNYSEETRKAYGYPSSSAPDGWVVGYSPSISIAMWTGYDTNTKGVYFTQSKMVAHRNALFRAVASAVMNDDNASFKRPSSVISVTVEKLSDPAALPSAATPSNQKITELFKKGTEPTTISTKYLKLNNASNLTVSYLSGDVKLSWSAASETSGLNTTELGSFGYKVYKDGAYLGFTNSTSYTYTTAIPYGKYTVKTTYSKSDTNISSGTSVTLTNEITFDYNDSYTESVSIGGTYTNESNPITVYKNGANVTSSATITTNIYNVTTSSNVSSVNTSSAAEYQITYTAVYSGHSRSYTKTVTVQ